MKELRKLLLFIVFIFFSLFSPYKCDNKSIKTNYLRKLNENFVKLKFYLDFTNFDEEFSQTSYINKKETFMKAINQSKNIIEDLISIDIGNNNYVDILEEELLDDWSINNYTRDIFDIHGYIQINENQNYIVFFKFSEQINYDATAKIMYGYANTPAIGLITFSKSIDSNKLNINYLTILMLHQFIHLLGFHPDVNGEFSSGLIDDSYEITSDSIIDYAKKYFDYDDLEKIVLENDEDDNVHWPSRLFLGELMTNLNYTEEQILSEFTLTFLDELTYLRVDKRYTGGLMKFGRHKGQDFYENNCGDDIDNNKLTFSNEFYTPTDTSKYPEPSCSSSRLSKTVYKLYSSETEPLNAEYFKNQLTGLKFTNYCPIAINELDEDEDIYTGYCSEETKTSKDTNIDEELGENSFCVLSSLVKEESDYQSKFRAVCYKMKCSSRSLTIKVGDNYIVCPRSGGQVKALNFKGYILCPDYNLICGGSSLCNNILDCIKKESTEKELVYDYTIKTTQNSIIYDSSEPKIAYGWEEVDSSTETTTCPYLCMQCNSEKCISCSPHSKFDEDNDKICVKKDPNCKTYLDYETDICIECYDSTNYFLAEEDENTFICLEKTEENLLLYFQTSKKMEDNSDLIYYKKCHYGVEYCEMCKSNNECIKCINNDLELIDNGEICGDLSTKKYYFDSEENKYKSCSKKSSNCKRCEIDSENNFKCIECDENYAFFHEEIESNICTDISTKYLNEYYTTDNMNYYSCINNLNNCIECESSTKCTLCESDISAMEENDVCILKTDIALYLYYYDSDISRYKSCSLISNCEKCISGEECISCKGEYKLIEGDDNSITCQNIDINNYYPITISETYEKTYYRKCEKDIENCIKCSSSNYCDECKENYAIIYNVFTKCEDLSTEKYYYDDDSSQYKFCYDKLSNCDTCTKNINGDNNLLCKKCQLNYALKYDNEIECSSKSSLEGNKMYYTNDTGDNYYSCLLYNDANNCLECDNKELCSKCQDNYILNNDKKSCIKNEEIENNMYYFNNELNIYVKCSQVISQCDKCNDGIKCDECNSESAMSNDDKCVSNNLIEEKKYFYDDNIKKYISCSIIDNCIKCDSSTVCTSCQNGFNINNNNICEKIVKESNNNLSTGGIVGIVFGCIGFLLIVAGVVYYLLKKLKNKNNNDNNFTEIANNNEVEVNDNKNNKEINDNNDEKVVEKSNRRSIHNK